jgi:hypothetical protein
VRHPRCRGSRRPCRRRPTRPHRGGQWPPQPQRARRAGPMRMRPPTSCCRCTTRSAGQRCTAARPGERHPSRPAPTPGQPRPPLPACASGQTRGRCPRPPGGPLAARHRRARPCLLAPRPGITGTAGNADQQQRRHRAAGAELVYVLGIVVAATAGGAAVAFMVAQAWRWRRAPLCLGEGGAGHPAAPARAAST